MGRTAMPRHLAMAQPVINPLLRRQLGSLASQARQIPMVPGAPKSAPPPLQAVAPEQVVDIAAETKVADTLRTDAMVFEVGLTFVFMHYQSIFIGVMRCLFQSFRPLLILFVFGQILKAVFFIAGAPIWLSFYSIWLFEVIYGLAQCSISFIFISFFYNNLSFARLRPALTRMARRQSNKLARF